MSRIRPYSSGDLERVLQIWEAASRVGHHFLTETFLAEERERVRLEHLPVADTWILDDGDEAVAFISLVGNEVGAVFVDPSHHRTGAGRALVDFAKTRHSTLEVEVFSANAAGCAFYRACGFDLLHEGVHAETGQPIARMRYQSG